MFNENTYYKNYCYSNYYPYNNSFIPTYYPNKDYNPYPDSQNINKIKESEETNQKEVVITEEAKENFDSSKKQYRLGPLSICNNSINIFGFDIALDDLIIIVLIILLLFQSETDYLLIIVLGLILLNVDFNSITSLFHLG